MGLQKEFRRDPNCLLSACSQGGEISRVCMCEEVRGLVNLDQLAGA